MGDALAPDRASSVAVKSRPSQQHSHDHIALFDHNGCRRWNCKGPELWLPLGSTVSQPATIEKQSQQAHYRAHAWRKQRSSISSPSQWKVQSSETLFALPMMTVLRFGSGRCLCNSPFFSSDLQTVERFFLALARVKVGWVKADPRWGKIG